MAIRKFFKDLKLFKRVRVSKDTTFKILDIVGHFFNLIYKLAMAFVPGIVCIYFLNTMFGILVLIGGFYRMILDITNCSSIKEIYLSLRWSFKNK